MIEALRAVRYTVGNLDQAERWYSQWLDVQPHPVTAGVLRYGVDGSWLELVEGPTVVDGRVQAFWGVDSLGLELERLQALGLHPQTPSALPPALLDANGPPTATFADPFGNLLGLVEVHDPHAQRARDHRAAEKIALRKVRDALDDLGAQDRQQRAANRLVLGLVVGVLVAGLVAGGIAWIKRQPPQGADNKLTLPQQYRK